MFMLSAISMPHKFVSLENVYVINSRITTTTTTTTTTIIMTKGTE